MSTPPESPTKNQQQGTVVVEDAAESLAAETPLNKKTDASESQAESQPYNKPDLVKDVIFWRNKRLNVLLLLVTTAMWSVLEIYGLNFITMASWVAMAVVSLVFLWGNFHRLLGKEAPDLSGLEISEQRAIESANILREQLEKGIRCMFKVGAEKEWFVFVGAVACLYALSLVASCFDLLALCYIGVIGGLSVPVMYVRYKHKIREYGERLKTKMQRLYIKIEEITQKMKEKIAERKEMKQKKVE